jgi:hypothetical protein
MASFGGHWVHRRILTAILLLFAVPVAAGGARAAGIETVAMPFDCMVDGGRVLLRPSETRSYTVLGDRDERQITACASPGATDCRTLIAHRFAISCGGRRVPWMRVVAAARRSASRDLWIEGGRMFLAVGRRAAPPGSCSDMPGRLPVRMAGQSGSRFGLPLVECLPWQRNRGVAHVALPPGFAPLGEIGARIVLDGAGAPPLVAASPPTAIAAAPLPASVAPPTSRPDPPPATRMPPVAVPIAVHPADPPARIEKALVTGEPIPETTPIPAVLAGADQSRAWVTMVRPEQLPETSVLARGPSAMVWSATALLAALLAAGAWRMWRRDGLAVAASAERTASGRTMFDSIRRGFRAPPAAPAGGPAGTETSVTNAAASLTALIEQANGSLDTLRSAPPLREVLEQELGVIRQRLAIVKAQASEGPEAAHKAAPVFRSLVRDLERVRRISESAALSLSSERVVGRLPKTRSEAYDLLGVHSDVSTATLKKLVDALRMCWHPDLARDESDRLAREERIKAINVAWELISGKRSAA